MKLTEDPEKQTLPGSKAAFRLLGPDGEAPLPPHGPPHQVPGAPTLFLPRTGSPLMDVLQLVEEPPPQPGQELRVWPQGAQEACVVRPARVEPLLRLCIQQGRVRASTDFLGPHATPELGPAPDPAPSFPLPLAV